MQSPSDETRVLRGESVSMTDIQPDFGSTAHDEQKAMSDEEAIEELIEKLHFPDDDVLHDDYVPPSKAKRSPEANLYGGNSQAKGTSASMQKSINTNTSEDSIPMHNRTKSWTQRLSHKMLRETKEKVDSRKELLIDLNKSEWDLLVDFCPTLSINPLESMAHELFGDIVDTLFIKVIQLHFGWWIVILGASFVAICITWYYENVIGYIFMLLFYSCFLTGILLTMNMKVAKYVLVNFESLVKIASCVGLSIALPFTCDKPRIMSWTTGPLMLLHTLSFIFSDATNLTPRINVLLGSSAMLLCIGIWWLINTGYSKCTVDDQGWHVSFHAYEPREVTLTCLSQLILFIGKQILTELRDIFVFQRDFCNSISIPVKIEWKIPKADAERLNVKKSSFGVIDIDISDSETESNSSITERDLYRMVC